MTSNPEREFAASYPRNEQDWILFPTRDHDLRRKYFPEEVFTHPAKMNLYLQQECIDYYTKPGDTILEPFGGVGSILMATLTGRNVIMLEIEDYYADICQQAMNFFKEEFEAPGQATLIRGDNRQTLPMIHPCDACITSPPYANTLSHSTAIVEEKEKLERYNLGRANALNLGRLNQFLFEQQMVRVYQGISNALKPGAPCIMVVKDIMKGGERQFLSEGVIRKCQAAGMKFESWYKWKPQGSMMQNIMRSKGADTVDDEDVIVFRKT